MSDNQTQTFQEMFESWTRMNSNVMRGFFELAGEPTKTENYEQIYRSWSSGMTEVIEKAMRTPNMSKFAWEAFKPMASMQKAGSQITETWLKNMNIPTHRDIAELSRRLNDLDDRLDRIEKKNASN